MHPICISVLRVRFNNKYKYIYNNTLRNKQLTQNYLPKQGTSGAIRNAASISHLQLHWNMRWRTAGQTASTSTTDCHYCSIYSSSQLGIIYAFTATWQLLFITHQTMQNKKFCFGNDVSYKYFTSKKLKQRMVTTQCSEKSDIFVFFHIFLTVFWQISWNFQVA